MSRRQVWITVAAILALLTVAYAPTLGFKYVQDSYHAVKANRVVDRGSIVEIFTSDYWKGTVSPVRTLYRPVTVLSFAVEKRVGGEAKPAVSHAVNVAIHGLTAFLLWLYARRLGASPAASTIAGLIFVAHPLLLQAVANVVGRADLLALGFSLGALYWMTYAESWRGGDPPSPWRQRVAIWGAAASLFLALGSKEIAIAAPFLILLQVLLFHLPTSAGGMVRRLAGLAPAVLAVTAYIVLRARAIDEFPGFQPVPAEDNVLVGMTGSARWATVLAMVARYAGLLLFPATLSADYSGTAIARESSLFAALPIVGLLAGLSCALLIVLASITLRRRLRSGEPVAAGGIAGLVAMSGCLIAVPYCIIGNVVVLNAAGFAERLIYFSAAGFCLLAGLALGAIADRAGLRNPGPRRVVLAAIGLLLLGAAFHTRDQSRMWESNRALFEHSLAVSPRSLRGYIATGERHLREGKTAEALALYETGLRHVPLHAAFWFEKGMIHARQRDLESAESALRRAIELRPEIGQAHAALGLVLMGRGLPEPAERAFRKALLLDPRQVEAAAQLGHLRFAQGRFREAALYYRGSVALGRDDLRERLQESEARATPGAAGRDR